MFFLLFKHTNYGVIDDFPKISDHFPKISEHSPKFVRGSHERYQTFSKKFPKIADGCGRLSRKTRRYFDHTPTNLSTINVTVPSCTCNNRDYNNKTIGNVWCNGWNTAPQLDPRWIGQIVGRYKSKSTQSKS